MRKAAAKAAAIANVILAMVAPAQLGARPRDDSVAVGGGFAIRFSQRRFKNRRERITLRLRAKLLI